MQRLGDVTVDKVKLIATLHFIQHGMRSRKIDLVPTDMWHFDRTIMEIESLAGTLYKTEAVLVTFLGMLEHDLQTETDTQKQFT